MAPKRPNPMEDPPAASSSEEEEEEVSSEEEEVEESPKEDSSSEEEENDDDMPPSYVEKPISKNLQSATAAVISRAVEPQLSDSDSSSETESDSDCEPDRHEPMAKSEPVAAKAAEKSSENERPKSSNVSALPAKRPNNAEQESKDVKRVKTDNGIAGEDEKKPGEDTKKQYFHRLWSEDDEVAVLKGMLDYKSKKGVSPYDDMNGFYEFIKKSISFDVSKVQLMDKIRGLKKKYVNNLGKGKIGGDKNFSKAHDQKAFDLSKNIWGTDSSVLDSAVKTNGKSKTKQKGKTKVLDSVKQELFSSPKGKKEIDAFEIPNPKIDGNETIPITKMLSVYGVDEVVAKQGWEMVSLEKKKVLEEKWKKLQVNVMEVYLQRSEFITEVAKLISEAFNGSDH